MTNGGNKGEDTTFALPSPLGGALSGAFFCFCILNFFGPIISAAAIVVGAALGAAAELIYRSFEGRG